MQFNLIEQIAGYYNLKPRSMRTYNIIKNTHCVGIWQKGKATVYFLRDDVMNEPKYKNVNRMSYDGTARHAYQIALNVLHDKTIQQQMGITL